MEALKETGDVLVATGQRREQPWGPREIQRSAGTRYWRNRPPPPEEHEPLITGKALILAQHVDKRI